MKQLVYISSVTSWPSEEDLKALLEQARARNLRQNITGMLLYKNATYLQVLEGEEKDVREIYQAIVNDPRNTGHVVLVEQDVEQRDFPGWCMGFQNLTDCKKAELDGFMDIFNEDVGEEYLVKNNSKACNLLKMFVKNS